VTPLTITVSPIPGSSRSQFSPEGEIGELAVRGYVDAA
jgi:hypothetical protein